MNVRFDPLTLGAEHAGPRGGFPTRFHVPFDSDAWEMELTPRG